MSRETGMSRNFMTWNLKRHYTIWVVACFNSYKDSPLTVAIHLNTITADTFDFNSNSIQSIYHFKGFISDLQKNKFLKTWIIFKWRAASLDFYISQTLNGRKREASIGQKMALFFCIKLSRTLKGGSKSGDCGPSFKTI